MKISLEWLTDFLAADRISDATILADRLTNAGFPIDSLEAFGKDQVLDVEITSNRGDCLCHLGIARELAAILDIPRTEPAVSVTESAEAASQSVRIRIDAPALCPQYTARLIRGVHIAPSPPWMIRRLEAVGIRPINNVVDVTNYVMFEMGQPLHAFDFAKVEGGQIIVRTAARGEKFVSLDNRNRELVSSMLVIADAQRPIALAGVMGGLDSEVSASTADVLLESAIFDPLCVRRTARALTMKSDSSYRFERGIDPTLPARASLRAAQLILQTAGGQLLKGIVRAGDETYRARSLSLRIPQIRRILGVDLPIAQVISAFQRLQLAPIERSDRIEVTIPPHRLDLTQEVDLIEEAARILGYGVIPTRDEISIRVVPPDLDSLTERSICQTLTASGYFEAVTFSFISDQLRGEFGASPLRADSAVRKADASLRPSLIPGLLEAVRFNEANGTAAAKLFEIGSIFPDAEHERRTVAWVGGDMRHVRGVAEELLARLDSQRNVQVVPDSRPGFAAGAAGRVLWAGHPIGFLGNIDRAIGEKLFLRDLPAAAELDLVPLLAGNRRVSQLRELPKFPAVRRDISLIVPVALPYEKIDSLIRRLSLPSLEAIEFVTTYRGKPLDAGVKSVTVTLVFRSASATLTSEQVESSVQQAIAAAKSQLGATLRT